jgi:hypothetical protein
MTGTYLSHGEFSLLEQILICLFVVKYVVAFHRNFCKRAISNVLLDVNGYRHHNSDITVPSSAEELLQTAPVRILEGDHPVNGLPSGRQVIRSGTYY